MAHQKLGVGVLTSSRQALALLVLACPVQVQRSLIVRQVAEHAQQAHNVTVTPELAAQVQALIREEE
jgi:hypothetical protein